MSNLEDLKLLVESIENQDVSLVTMRSKPSGKHNTKYTIVVSSKEPRNDLKNNNKTNNNIYFFHCISSLLFFFRTFHLKFQL